MTDIFADHQYRQVSQRLFNVLAGRAVESGPIEPRTKREASLIEAVSYRIKTSSVVTILSRINSLELTPPHDIMKNHFWNHIRR